MSSICSKIIGLATLAAIAQAVPFVKRQGISITPHASYSSSIGVLGCKIDTNRVAYWPIEPGCDSMCVQVSANGRTVNLLQVDTSGGAYDISYDAWNYLSTGQGAAADPTMGGGIDATYTQVDMSQCAANIKTPDGKLAFSAANSMNFVSSCLSNSWFSSNYALYNIDTPTCTYGYDEVCSLDLTVSNQPTCPHMLGEQAALTTDPVYNIEYGTGTSVLATS